MKYELRNLDSDEVVEPEFYAGDEPSYLKAVRYLETRLRNESLPDGMWVVVAVSGDGR